MAVPSAGGAGQPRVPCTAVPAREVGGKAALDKQGRSAGQPLHGMRRRDGRASSHQNIPAVRSSSSQASNGQKIDVCLSSSWERALSVAYKDERGGNAERQRANKAATQRRGPAVSITHLLNFQVSSGEPIVGLYAAARRAPRASQSGGPLASARYIHANFRFIARCRSDGTDGACCAMARDPDRPVDWSDVERVLVPTSHDAVCPICLDVPVAPRLTQCGHFFCWACILRYAQSQASGDSPGTQWHKCPVCVEAVSVRSLCGVRFVHVPDYSAQRLGSSLVVPMVLLVRDSDSTIVRRVSSLVESNDALCNGSDLFGAELSDEDAALSPCDADHALNTSGALPCNMKSPLDGECPFTKVQWADRRQLLQLVEADAAELVAHIESLHPEDPDIEFLRLALRMATDRCRALSGEPSTPGECLTVASGANCDSTCKPKHLQLGADRDLDAAGDLKHASNGGVYHSPKSDIAGTATTAADGPTQLSTGKKSASKHDSTVRQRQAHVCTGNIPTSSSEDAVFFHQAADGQPFFLTPLSIRVLRSAFGSYADMPRELAAPVMDIEHLVVTEEVRRKHRHIAHLPLGAQIALCELDRRGVVPPSALAAHAAETERRAAARSERARVEAAEDLARRQRVEAAHEKLYAGAATRTIPCS